MTLRALLAALQNHELPLAGLLASDLAVPPPANEVGVYGQLVVAIVALVFLALKLVDRSRGTDPGAAGVQQLERLGRLESALAPLARVESALDRLERLHQQVDSPFSTVGLRDTLSRVEAAVVESHRLAAKSCAIVRGIDDRAREDRARLVRVSGRVRALVRKSEGYDPEDSDGG